MRSSYANQGDNCVSLKDVFSQIFKYVENTWNSSKPFPEVLKAFGKLPSPSRGNADSEQDEGRSPVIAARHIIGVLVEKHVFEFACKLLQGISIVRLEREF